MESITKGSIMIHSVMETKNQRL